MQTTVERFQQSLQDMGVGVTRTTPDAFPDALEDAIVEPAVGVALGIDGVSLAETNVELDLTPERLQRAETGVTPVGAGVAEHGSILVQSTADGAEPVSLYPPRHVAVVREGDLLGDVEAATEWLAEEFAVGRDSAVFATGVSATGDMGALVEGVHGPGEVHVVVLTEGES